MNIVAFFKNKFQGMSKDKIGLISGLGLLYCVFGIGAIPTLFGSSFSLFAISKFVFVSFNMILFWLIIIVLFFKFVDWVRDNFHDGKS